MLLCCLCDSRRLTLHFQLHKTQTHNMRSFIPCRAETTSWSNITKLHLQVELFKDNSDIFSLCIKCDCSSNSLCFHKQFLQVETLESSGNIWGTFMIISLVVALPWNQDCFNPKSLNAVWLHLISFSSAVKLNEAPQVVFYWAGNEVWASEPHTDSLMLGKLQAFM